LGPTELIDEERQLEELEYKVMDKFGSVFLKGWVIPPQEIGAVHNTNQIHEALYVELRVTEGRGGGRHPHTHIQSLELLLIRLVCGVEERSEHPLIVTKTHRKQQ
jgi:hypothetical protein